MIVPETNAPAPQFAASFSKRVRTAVGLWSMQFNVGRRWSRAEANPAAPASLPVRLFGIVGTWCEADVIEATVQNAFAQGCERVFIVDNASPDDTVERAAAAGAEIASMYHTDYYDDQVRLAEMNGRHQRRVARGGRRPRLVAALRCGRVRPWPAGLRIVDYLAGLDRRFRVVGARVFDHFPTSEPANVPGRHPLDYQPLCQELQMAWCSLRHWKHPLIRWDRSGPEVRPDHGFHRVRAPFRVEEPREGVFMHHFQYRNRPETAERLRRLCEATGRWRGSFGFGRRLSRSATPPLVGGGRRSTTSTPRTGPTLSGRPRGAHARAWTRGRGLPWCLRPTQMRRDGIRRREPKIRGSGVPPFFGSHSEPERLTMRVPARNCMYAP